MNDDPFDDDFFPSKTKLFAGGIVSVVVSLVLTIVFYGVVLAVLLWVGLTVLEHFDVLMLGLGGV